MKGINLSKTIGKNIKNAIKESNLSQEEVSKKIGISRQTLNNYINGITLIDFEKLLDVANLTGRNIDFLQNQSIIWKLQIQVRYLYR